MTEEVTTRYIADDGEVFKDPVSAEGTKGVWSRAT